MVRRRNNIVLAKRDAPHNVTLPNGRTFYAKFRRVTKEYLPGSTKIARTYKGLPVKVKHKKINSLHMLQLLKDYQSGWFKQIRLNLYKDQETYLLG